MAISIGCAKGGQSMVAIERIFTSIVLVSVLTALWATNRNRNLAIQRTVARIAITAVVAV